MSSGRVGPGVEHDPSTSNRTSLVCNDVTSCSYTRILNWASLHLDTSKKLLGAQFPDLHLKILDLSILQTFGAYKEKSNTTRRFNQENFVWFWYLHQQTRFSRHTTIWILDLIQKGSSSASDRYSVKHFRMTRFRQWETYCLTKWNGNCGNIMTPLSEAKSALGFAQQ
jgi:hypothetical protein